MKKKHQFSSFILILVLIYLFVPVLITIVFSFSTAWHHTILPEGFTLRNYITLFSDPVVLQALLRSIILCGTTSILSLIVIVPMTFIVLTFFPTYEKHLQSLLMLTYAVPGILLAIGLIRTYAGLGIPMVLIIVGVYIITLLPVIYQSVKNSLVAIHGIELVQSASLLGASLFQTFYRIILPSIGSGIFIAWLLSFSILFGEFTLVNMLLGGKFKTLQMVLYEITNKDIHVASSLTSAYFLMMGLFTLFLIKLNRHNIKNR